jgi:hypothetical protein
MRKFATHHLNPPLNSYERYFLLNHVFLRKNEYKSICLFYSFIHIFNNHSIFVTYNYYSFTESLFSTLIQPNIIRSSIFILSAIFWLIHLFVIYLT